MLEVTDVLDHRLHVDVLEGRHRRISGPGGVVARGGLAGRRGKRVASPVEAVGKVRVVDHAVLLTGQTTRIKQGPQF